MFFSARALFGAHTQQRARIIVRVRIRPIITRDVSRVSAHRAQHKRDVVIARWECGYRACTLYRGKFVAYRCMFAPISRRNFVLVEQQSDTLLLIACEQSHDRIGTNDRSHARIEMNNAL
jgi:hypothetical protein